MEVFPRFGRVVAGVWFARRCLDGIRRARLQAYRVELIEEGGMRLVVGWEDGGTGMGGRGVSVLI